MKKIFLILALGILLANVAAATTTTATVTFPSVNSEDTRFPAEGQIDSDTFMLIIKTPYSRVLCRYSTVEGSSFDSMSGFSDGEFETVHQKVFTSVSDGVHRYYVKCRDMNDLSNSSLGVAALEAVVTVNSRIGAMISIDSDSNILTEGKYELSLQTTKVPSDTPELSYSYDGVKYETILLHGSGKSWKGLLNIPQNTGEQSGVFKFQSKDLEGRIGTKIYSGENFEVDTKAPKAISTLKATGEYGQIRLEWTNEESDVDSIKIYKSTEPNVDESDFYKSIDPKDEYYVDTSVSKGKTYYYKIAAVDSAENSGEFSREVSAVQRNDNSTVASGLSSNLVSLVDALLTEIDLVKDDISTSNSKINSMEESNLLETIGLQDDLKSSSSELSALEKEAVNYKLQDLTKETLETRLASSRIKLSMIKKKIPSTVSLIDSNTKTIPTNENNIRLALLKYSPQMTPSEIEKSIKKTLKAAEENNLEITAEISVFEVTYSDGSKSSSSIIEYKLNSILEKSPTTSFILNLPDGISGIDMKNRAYDEIGQNLYKFETDTKSIIYVVNEELDPSILNDIVLSLVDTPEETAAITGYFFSNVSSSGSIGIAILIFLAMSLVAYLVIMKNKNQEESVSNFIKKAHDVKQLRDSGKNEEANSLYESLKVDYLGLSQEQKSKVFNKISHLHKK